MKTFKLQWVKDSPKKDCYISICPSCPDRTGHVEVNQARGLFYCFRCGVGGHLDPAGPPSVKRRPREVPARTHWEIGETWAEGISDRYLRSRGFNNHLIEELDPHKGPNPYYIYFPVPNTENYTDFWTARLWWEGDGKKWLFPPGSPGASHRMWGIHRIPQDEDDVILVEGIFDAVWAYNRLSIFGTSISDSQIKMIRSIHPKTVYVALDPDAWGKTGVLIRRLTAGYTCNIKVVKLPNGKDLCDMGWEGTEYIYDAAEDW